jgi:protein SCO1/2
MRALLELMGLAAAEAAPETASTVIAGYRRDFPNPKLVTQAGRAVRLYDDLVRRRVVMMNFAYTRCTGRCPRAASQLVTVQRMLGERFGPEVTLLTLSLDPEHDTPEQTRRYMQAHGGRSGWTWLTGLRDDLEQVRRFLGFVDRDPRIDADRTRHTTLVAIGNDRTGHWASMPALIRPELVVEAVLRIAGVRLSGGTASACAP